MKKNSKIIIGISILSVFIILLVGVMIFLLVGNKRWLPKMNFFTVTKISKNIVLDETYQEEFNKILIEQNLGDVEIKQSIDDKIRVVIYGKKDHAKITKNENLSISYQEEECKFFCIGEKLSKIEVYLPNTNPKEIAIKNKYGDIEVGRFDKINMKIKADCGDIHVIEVGEAIIENDYGDIEVGKANKLNIKESCGDVEIREVANIDLENNYGDIEIGNITNSLNIKQDCGDVSIDYADLKENSEIVNSYGDIEIDDIGDIYIDAKTSLGDVNVDKNMRTSSTTLKIRNSCGDIEVGDE